jgi:pimeloyl-ACP methyl ester carboxylesterase
MSADQGLVEVRPGRRVAWTALGDGPPLLLVNGYAATGLDWDPSFLGLLAARHRLICPDNVGLGRSLLADDGEVGGVEGMTADMVALLDALEIERAAVAGWSMGGFVAQSLARQVPERVAALGLISTHTGGPECVNGEPQIWGG